VRKRVVQGLVFFGKFLKSQEQLSIPSQVNIRLFIIVFVFLLFFLLLVFLLFLLNLIPFLVLVHVLVLVVLKGFTFVCIEVRILLVPIGAH